MQVIRYVGLAHVRRITAREWKAAGFVNGETIEWSFENGFEVPSNDLTTEQIAAVIAPDSGFVLVDVEKLRGRLPHPMTPAQARTSNNLAQVVTKSDTAEE